MNSESRIQATMAIPPTALQLLGALSWLDVPNLRDAALHLATPIQIIPSVAISKNDKGSAWRNCFSQSGRGIAGACQEAARLATQAHREGDRYLNLSVANQNQVSFAEMSAWSKPLLSGGRKILFGVGVLFDGPVFNSDQGVSNSDLRGVLAWWLEDRQNEVGAHEPKAAIVDCPDGLVIAWEKSKVVRVENYMRG